MPPMNIIFEQRRSSWNWAQSSPFVSLFLWVANSCRSRTFPILKFVGQLSHKDHLRSLDGLVLEEGDP